MTWARAKYEDVRIDLKPGDVIAFGGHGGFSWIIKWWTYNTVDHVAVVLQSNPPDDDELHVGSTHQIIEVTSPRDEKPGVTINKLQERLAAFEGEIWWLPLNDNIRQKLTLEKFQDFLHQQIGRPYDPLQEAKSAPDVIDNAPLIGRITRSKEDFSRFFSSELVAAGLEAGGAIDSINASETTPMDLCRFSIYQEKYYQLKGSKKLITGYNTQIPEGWGEQREPFSIKQMIIHYPIMLGLMISGMLLSILLLQEVFMGRLEIIFGPMATPRDFRLAVVHCLLAGYLPSACLYLLYGAKNTIDDIDSALKPVDTPFSIYAFIHIGKKRLIIAGLLGVLFAVFSPYLTAETPPWDPTAWNLEVWWHRILGPFIGWWLGWFVLFTWDTSTQTSRLAARIETIDLLDLSPLSPFVKQGLLTSLLIVGAVSIASLFLFEPDQWPVVVIAVGICLPLIIIGLMLPLRGVHRRIREAKQLELEWTLEKIRQSKLALQDAPAERSSGQVADWISYYQLIDDVPEWPIEGSTIVRVTLYLMIPALSWLISLLIEGLLDKLFR